MKIAPLLRWGIILYLLFPFLFLFFQFRILDWPDLKEFLWAFKNSCLQAFFSALFAMILGVWAALGLISFSPRKRTWRIVMEVLCLFPNFLPSLFILLATLNLLDPFPMGISGMVIIHTMLNFGLVAVLVAGLIERKVGHFAELAWLEGASAFLFLRKVFFPLLRRDLFLISLLIFVICFGSFAIPLIVGGARGTTLEVLIYEKIRLSNKWGEAVLLALFQSGFIFSLSMLAHRAKGDLSLAKPVRLNLLQRPSGNLFVLFCAAFYLVGYGQGLISGLRSLGNFYEIQSEVLLGFFGTLFVGLLVGIFCFILLMLFAYLSPHRWFERFLKGYVAPSTSLACFAFLLVGPNESFWPFLKIPLAFTMLSINSLYRMGWESRLQLLQKQITIAQLMGGSRELIFQKILFPQLATTAGLLSGLAAVWATGDFAVSRILGHRDLTIGMMSETLMASYRLNMATVLTALILLAGVICFGLFYGGGRVLSRKSSL